MSGWETGLSEGHVNRRRRLKLLHDQLEDCFDECRVDLDFVDHDLDGVRILANRQGDILKGGRFFGGLLQTVEGLGARVEFSACAGYDPARFHDVDLYALLTLGRVAKVLLGLKAGGFGECAQDHVTIADLDRLLVGDTFPWLRSIERVADGAPRSDPEFNGPGPAVFVQKVAENELVRPCAHIPGRTSSFSATFCTKTAGPGPLN